MSAYYNDIDPAAAHVLRALIADGVIAPGEVDTRSIKEVQPDDLRGFVQCHFFAGGGLWSIAARLAGWPDDRPLWTGSCPCQGESTAGKLLGAADPRHLWPDLYRLGRAARPPVLVGEQVANAAGTHWLDRVATDLDDAKYAFRAVDIPAAAVDAPHIRQRLYWCAVADGDGRGRAGWPEDAQRSALERDVVERSAGGELEHAACVGWREGRSEYGVRGGRATSAGADARQRRNMGDAERARLEGQRGDGDAGGRPITAGSVTAPDGRNGSYWSGSEWLVCHDGKARRAKPGLRLLVDGLPGRVDLWRIGGNAIVPHLAAEVLAALKDDLDGNRPLCLNEVDLFA